MIPTLPTIPSLGLEAVSVPLSAFPKVSTLLDDFERTSEAPISAPWSGTAAGGVASLRVDQATFAQEGGGSSVSGRARQYNATGQPGVDIALLTGPYGPDVQVWGQIPSVGDTLDQYVFAVRVTGAGSAAWTGYYLRLNVNTNWQIVRRLTGPVETVLATQSWGAPGLSDFGYFGFSAIGSSLKGYFRPNTAGAWSEFISATDSNLTGAGAIGARILVNDPAIPGDPMIEFLRGGTAT